MNSEIVARLLETYSQDNWIQKEYEEFDHRDMIGLYDAGGDLNAQRTAFLEAIRDVIQEELEKLGERR